MSFNKKATDEQIINTYKEVGNIWKAGKLLNMCGQSVHERLKKLNIKLNSNPLTDYEKLLIRELYASGIKKSDGKLKELSLKINRTIPFI